MLLIGGILLWMMYSNQPTPEEIEAEKARIAQEDSLSQLEAEQPVTNQITPQEVNAANATDSTALVGLQNRLGSFAYSGTLPSARSRNITFLWP